MTAQTTSRLTVGVGDMKMSSQRGEIIVTHALGSCIGIALHDPVACIGGILHYMLPDGGQMPERAESRPWMFATTAIPLFLAQAYKLGAAKPRMILKVAGGSQILDDNGVFAIGKRNHTIMRKLLWQQGLLVKAEHVGGSFSRTLFLEIGTGRTWMNIGGKEIEL